MTDITRIDPTEPPMPRMSRAVVHNGTVFLAGLTAGDTSLDIQGQTRDVLERIDHYLAEAGTDKSHLLQAQVWITDMRHFQAMNEVWNGWVDPANQPARACVEANLARPGLLVEVMVTAALPS